MEGELHVLRESLNKALDDHVNSPPEYKEHYKELLTKVQFDYEVKMGEIRGLKNCFKL